ncbi:MAG: hypothetical protein K1X67_09420 [Fimbriimonadaceae bacterium]|nr:hypothetical protein [Fimbriimonadaceae bacterium]
MPRAQTDGPVAGIKEGKPEAVLSAKPEGESEGPAAPERIRLRLINPHKLIAETLERDEQEAKLRKQGMPIWSKADKVDVSTGPVMRRTALAVFDRLFKLLERNHIYVTVSARGMDGPTQTAVSSNHWMDRVPVRIYEVREKVPHVPTPKELKEKEIWPSTRIPACDEVWTGNLLLDPGGLVDLSSEAALDAVLENAKQLLQERLATAATDRLRREEVHRQEQQKRAEIEAEKQRIDAVDQAAEALRRFRLWADYIEEVRRVGVVPPEQRRNGQTFEEWIEWAEWRAREIHPLS